MGLRVLMQNRPDSFEFPGGDTVQMLETKRQLENLGVEVSVDLSESPDVSAYDVVHVFNTLSMPSSYYQVMNAKSQGKPVTLSTIFWDVGALEKNKRAWRTTFKEGINALLRTFTGREIVARDCFERQVVYYQQQEAALLASDCLLPNARTELEQIRRAFPRVRNKAHIVPNGVDPNITLGDAERFRRQYGIYEEFVLCVANVSPRKNQLRLVKACRMCGYLVVLVGGCLDWNRQYLDSCLKAGRDRVCYLGPMSHDAVADAFAACRVHALPSSVETPGLATLEAVACGKNVVVCDRGSVREYLEEEAFYCDYYSIDSIACALSQAWRAEPPVQLTSRVLEKYTWRRAAEETLKAYQLVASRIQSSSETLGTL
ncbi:MAG: glycosyltransferase [Armatimonadota bacterium]|nr:glycosyltransferase [Armatimonadota bacterium]